MSRSVSRVARARWLTAIVAAVVLASFSGALPAIADVTPKPVSPPSSDPFNDRLSVTVGSDGRFSQGAFPDATNGGSSATSFTTLYGWPSTGTSFTTVRVDGVDHIFGGSDGTWVQPPSDFGAENVGVWSVGGINVTQHLQLVTNPATGHWDTAAISYTLANNGTTEHTAGVRVMLDTDVNGNDGAPFRLPGVGLVTTESDLTGAAIPDTFQVFQDLGDSQHLAAGILRGAFATPPDRVVIAAWPLIYRRTWDYTTSPAQPITSDSAYAVYWNPTSIPAGGSRAVTTYYGLSDVTVDMTPPIALGLTGPTSLTAVNGGYSPFTFTATVSDSGNGDANGVQLALNLPAGLHASTPVTVPVGTLSPGGGEQQVSWRITADARDSDATLNYSVTVTADNASAKTVSRTLFVPLTASLLPTKYIALGDSYQSGEGAYSYQPGTDTAGDQCHRSTKSYPYLVGSALTIDTTSVACSGAVLANLTNGQDGEPAQYKALSDADALVTVGIGGNDLGFADIFRACALGPQLSGDYFSVNQTCHGRFDKQVNDAIAAIERPDPVTGLSPLGTVYNEIRKRAPRARIIVVGYPKFFIQGGNNIVGCNLIWRSDQVWINAKIKQFDDAIARVAGALGVEYAAGADVFADGHELCDSGEAYLNGVIPDVVNRRAAPESFHPNVSGHQRIADELLFHVRGPRPGNTFLIGQGQTVTSAQTVNVGQGWASFLSTWPGSDVQMSLTDPAGHEYTRAALAGATFHSNGPTSELFVIADPVPGTWIVKLYGAQIAVGGESVNLSVNQSLPANKIPVAVAKANTSAGGTTVTYDGTGSYDPDGTITGYQWDFGDGTVATGPVVTHIYTNLGHLDQPTLIVTDSRDDQGFLELDPVKVHYAFDGFRPPVSKSGPMTANAGRAIPFKWGLADPSGKEVTTLSAVAGHTFDAAGATTTLTYDAGGHQFVLTAKTPKSWAGTTRTFTLKFNDQSVHTQVVKF